MITAQKLKQNRSRLVRRALTGLLQRRKQKELGSLMAEGYQEISQVDSDIVAEGRLLQAAATKGVWKWDDE